MDDINNPYYFECTCCGRMYHISYRDMVADGWKVAYHKGFVCPACTSKCDDAVSIEEAQANRKENGWTSLVRP